MIRPSLALELALEPKGLTKMLHQEDLLLSAQAKDLTHPTTSTEAHHRETGVVVVLQDLAQALTLGTCRIPLLLAGSLLVKDFRAALVDPMVPEVLEVLDLGATILFHQALAVPVLLALTHLLKLPRTNEPLQALVPHKMRSQLLLVLAPIEPSQPLPADRQHLPRNPNRWLKVCDSPLMPLHHLSNRNLRLRKSSRLLRA